MQCMGSLFTSNASLRNVSEKTGYVNQAEAIAFAGRHILAEEQEPMPFAPREGGTAHSARILLLGIHC